MTQLVPGICIFCGRRQRSGESWREHNAPPKWLQRMFVLPEGGTLTGTKLYRGVPVSGQPTGIVRNRVCTECNTTWMRDIQNAAIPIITKMLVKQPGTIFVAEQEVIVKWITRTLMVAEWAEQTRTEAYFTKAERDELRTGTWNPSRNVVVWLARRAPPLIEPHVLIHLWGVGGRLGPFDIPVLNDVLDLKTGSLREVPGTTRVDANITIFYAGPAVFQTLFLRIPAWIDPGRPLFEAGIPTLDQREKSWRKKTLRFGPPSRDLAWPPNKDLGTDAELRRFAGRFGPDILSPEPWAEAP